MAQQLGSFEKVLRVGEGRRLKRLGEQAAYIGTLEPDFEKLSDSELAAKTVEFRQRIENGEHLDEVLFEAFAAVREAYKRTMGVRLFDVQLMGGVVLHEGDIARVAAQLQGYRAIPGDPKGAAETAGADYEFDEKHKTVAVTEQGVAKVERALRIDNLYAPQNSQLVNHLVQALKAQSLYHNDVEYVIQDGEVKIVDEFTGRIMEGRRWSEGLHQAVEAKEGVRIQEEHQTMATITLQNYFRLYDKLGGMTGTAKTEEKEFVEIYNLHVVEIPTNVAVARRDEQDLVFKTKEGKFAAVARDIKERSDTGQPVLVGTIAVETSEYLSQLLTRQGVQHNVLNAKEHAREAEIIKDAGQVGAVTIATNMAGRGVDIKLGEGVREVGGLYVVGTERHESRRIDNQLRGRSGRQGDPGETRFYLSGEDDLVRLFAGDRIKGIMERFKIPEDQPMEAKILSSQIEGAQKQVEA